MRWTFVRGAQRSKIGPRVRAAIRICALSTPDHLPVTDGRRRGNASPATLSGPASIRPCRTPGIVGSRRARTDSSTPGDKPLRRQPRESLSSSPARRMSSHHGGIRYVLASEDVRRINCAELRYRALGRADRCQERHSHGAVRRPCSPKGIQIRPSARFQHG